MTKNNALEAYRNDVDTENNGMITFAVIFFIYKTF